MSQAPEPHVLYLHCLQGKERGQRFRLQPGDRVQIGRDPGEPGITISDLLASRHHAEILADDAHATIRDLDSANGTRINGKAVLEAQILHAGDILTIGHSSFVLEDPRINSTTDNADGTRTLRKQQSARLRKQLERTRDVPDTVEALNRQGGSEVALLTTLLASLPLAVLVFDEGKHVITANDLMRSLTGSLPLEPSQDAAFGLTVLADQLRYPDDLAAALGSDDHRPVRLELASTDDHWILWHYRQDRTTVLFLLEERALGSSRSLRYSRTDTRTAQTS
jgi:pSer/pThr/pTyr-binding forkhead associated (FHA) protein